ncbi:MAG: DUF4102 domain-containing protein [Gammaproteobacteria bacterium]|nr:DUF4102 domain-containing protein [Gammaproteobacteria bacterium]MYG65838.1 DUF4102 domain-containing protein [Gammaproteobacteria bacterium]
METNVKRVAQIRVSLTKRAVESMEPADRPYIAWDDRLTGFGVRIQPSGIRTFVVNYRAGDGGRRAANRRVTLGRFGRMTPDEARRKAKKILGQVASGEDPAGERAVVRAMPTLGEAFEEYLAANPKRKEKTVQLYRRNLRVCFGDWISRPMDRIGRLDVEARFNRITESNSWSTANQATSMLRAIYRRSCIDHESLRNPVELWTAGGGRFNPKRRRRISSPDEVLPRWFAAVEAVDMPEDHRDIFLVGAYTGMRLGEVVSLQWDRIDLEQQILRVEETKTGEPLELPITRQLAAVFGRRREERQGPATREDANDGSDAEDGGWVFPSPLNPRGYLTGIHRYHADISREAGTRFWFHGLRNAFITVAERELMLPRSLTKRLVNHARPTDVTEGYAADWTVHQLRGPAQQVADRIDELVQASPSEATA